jgi:predicted site-specific integrase-resolvase
MGDVKKVSITKEDLQKLSKTELARVLGVHYNTIYRWAKQGILDEKLEAFEKIAEFWEKFKPVRETNLSKFKGKRAGYKVALPTAKKQGKRARPKRVA